MAYIAQDPNTSSQVNTTDVLSGQNVGQTQPESTPQQAPSQPTTSGGGSSSSYVSDGNPYGKYASQTSRKTTSAPSSGSFTNVQTYVDKNKQSSEQLGKGVSNTLTTTSDIARKNLQGVQNQFQQGVQAGSLEDYGNALNQAKTAYNEAASGKATTKAQNGIQATMYAPTKNDQGAYSVEDQALIDANKARVNFGDGSTKEYNTQAEAQNAIDTYNASNPTYYSYGQQNPLSVSNQRLSDILNASYQGPNELSEIGGYNQAYNQYQDLSGLQKQALSAGPKTELLNRTFATPNTQYNMGNKLLDELLLGQGNANKILTDTAKNLGQSATGKVADEFSDVSKGARTLAQNQTKEMENIKNTARQELNATANTRSKEVNDRINEVVSNWEKYPQYFRDRFQQELDSYGVKVDLNKKFNEIANTYSGGYDKATQDLSSASNRIAELNKTIGNINPEEVSYVSEIATKFHPQYSGADYGQFDPQVLQKIFDSASSLGVGVPTTGGVMLPLNIQTFQNMSASEKYELGQKIQNALGGVVNERERLKNTVGNATDVINKAEPYLAGKDIDPNAFNLGLSQLEAEALGVKGGEGLYNLLKEQGVEGLLKTATADKNRLISQDEQSQLARLQSIAELAKGYGAAGSGIDYRNQFTNRDLAGTQDATSALDLDNFKNLVQGAERGFRTDAQSSNIAGTGYGTGSSGGAFGTKRAQSWKTLEKNFGDLLTENDAYRNMYSDQGVNKDLLRQIAQSAQGEQTFESGFVNPDLVGTIQDTAALPTDLLQGILGTNTAGQAATNYAMLTNPVTAPLALANMFGNFVGGSSGEAQGRADYAAYQNALANLQQNITNKVNTSGLKNQFSVNQNNAQDLELYKLLGMLDTTNI